MKLACLSDTHTFYEEVSVQPADVLIHAGDWNCYYSKSLKKFIKWLKKQPVKHCVVVAGNHDKFAEQENKKTREYFEKAGIHYLENSGVEIDGVKFWGSPYTPKFMNWWFMSERGDKILTHWKKIPAGTDVLITHGPPFGILDGDYYANGDLKANVGCMDLLNMVKELKPKLHVFGHIHADYGVEQREETLFVNCALCAASGINRIVNAPMIFDMPG
jgi:Icc-related predicted phosphoesterase